MKTLILRFSDAEREETSTVDAHNEIIRTKGVTWWGWWKKEHEIFKGDLLQQINGYARARNVRIGLVNRKGSERLYVAICTACESRDGEPLPSPDAELTPKYYASDAFPAWFKLSRIEEVSRSDFEREFGEVPSLDPTLYEVIPEGAKTRVIPSRTWNLQPIVTSGEAILHISDMHFGEFHGYPLATRPGRGTDILPLSDVIMEGIRKFLKVPIGVLVASGDFITKGNANSYPDAHDFLDQLLFDLGLKRDHCVIVPGNHDLWTLDEEHPTRTYRHEAPYRMFAERFVKGEIQDLEKTARIRIPSGVDLIFVSLNSARIRSDKLKEYGYVSRHRYDELLKYVKSSLLADRAAKQALVFAVLHHHIMPVAKLDVPEEMRPVSLTLDAGELIEDFCNANIGYVLHGHQHIPFAGLASKLNVPGKNQDTWTPSRGNLFVLGCGSTGMKLSAEVPKNIFGVYTPTPNALEVTFFQFAPHEDCSILWSGSLPLQNFYEMARA
jgi:predicted MPP superfamily phosphohydrolase